MSVISISEAQRDTVARVIAAANYDVAAKVMEEVGHTDVFRLTRLSCDELVATATMREAWMTFDRRFNAETYVSFSAPGSQVSEHDAAMSLEWGVVGSDATCEVEYRPRHRGGIQRFCFQFTLMTEFPAVMENSEPRQVVYA